MAVTETITNVYPVDIASGDVHVSEYDINLKNGVVFCRGAGTCVVEMKDGTQTQKDLLTGEYWRISPAKFIQAGSTATVELHT